MHSPCTLHQHNQIHRITPARLNFARMEARVRSYGAADPRLMPAVGGIESGISEAHRADRGQRLQGSGSGVLNQRSLELCE